MSGVQFQVEYGVMDDLGNFRGGAGSKSLAQAEAHRDWLDGEHREDIKNNALEEELAQTRSEQRFGVRKWRDRWYRRSTHESGPIDGGYQARTFHVVSRLVTAWTPVASSDGSPHVLSAAEQRR